MLVTAALKGIRRELGVAPAKKAPAMALRLVEMVRLCPATLQGRRDRALLLGFAGAFRRSELVALQVKDLEVLPLGLKVTIRRSKTDQEGAGQVIAIARGEAHCPVAAGQDWLAAAAITTGPVLRRVRKGGAWATRRCRTGRWPTSSRTTPSAPASTRKPSAATRCAPGS